MRRPRVGWMTKSDDAILEFLLNEPARPIRATPGVVAANINFAKSTINDRLPSLLQTNLVEYYDESAGIYQITEKGKRYLSGEISEDELQIDGE